MAYPATYRYTREHEWIEVGATARWASPITRKTPWETLSSSTCQRWGQRREGQGLWQRGVGQGRIGSLLAGDRHRDRGQRGAGNGSGKDQHRRPRGVDAQSEDRGSLQVEQLLMPRTTKSTSRKKPTETETHSVTVNAHERGPPMRYLPKSPGERIEMLQQIGAGSIDDLFSTIPQEYRLERDLDVPRQMAESEIVEYFRHAVG